MLMDTNDNAGLKFPMDAFTLPAFGPFFFVAGM